MAPVRAPERDSAAAEFGDVKELIGFQLRRAHTQMSLHWQMHARQQGVGITPVQAGMMLEVSSSPGLSQADLARRMSVEGPTLIQAIDRLEAAGLLTRNRHANDRRRYALQLTPQGEAELVAVRRFLRRRDDELLEGLTDRERDLLLTLLQRVVRQGHSVLGDNDVNVRLREIL